MCKLNITFNAIPKDAFACSYYPIYLSVYDKVAFALKEAMKAQMGSRGTLYSFFNLCSRWGWVVDIMPWPLYSWERDPVPIV
jgi:hypothetical protein